MKLFPRSSFPGTNHKRNSCSTQRGFQLLELIIVLGALVGLMGMFSKHLQRELQQTANQAVAYQLRQVTRAAYQYAQDNYLSLSGAASPSITLQKLLDEGYLGNQLPKKNLYDQSYTIEVIENDPAVNPAIKIKSLQILVTTHGGRVIDGDSVRAIASKLGGEGGYSSITMPGKIIGSAGGWEMSAPGTEDGHLASLTVVNEKDVMANYYVSNGEEDLLHRVKVDGHPEYNRMETDLAMAQDKKISFGPDGDDKKAELAAHRFHMGNKNDDWTTDIVPTEIRLESKSSGNKSYVGNDGFRLDNPSNWVTNITPAVINLEDKPKGEKAYLSNNTIWLKNKTNTTEITPTSIRVGEIFADKITLIGAPNSDKSYGSLKTVISPGAIHVYCIFNNQNARDNTMTITPSEVLLRSYEHKKLYGYTFMNGLSFRVATMYGSTDNHRIGADLSYDDGVDVFPRDFYPIGVEDGYIKDE